MGELMEEDPVTDPRTDDNTFLELTTRRGSGWIIQQLVQLGCLANKHILRNEPNLSTTGDIAANVGISDER